MNHLSANTSSYTGKYTDSWQISNSSKQWRLLVTEQCSNSLLKCEQPLSAHLGARLTKTFTFSRRHKEKSRGKQGGEKEALNLIF